MRKFVSLIAAVLAAGALLATAPVASASGTGYTSTSSTMFQCQDTRCPSIRTVPGGVGITIYCWRDGDSYAGSSRWFRANYGGSQGWVSTGVIRSPQPSVPYCSDVQVNERVYPGESVWSPDGRYRLVMQGDGNLVTYGPSGAIWASNTSNGYFAIMQSDGNFVVYTSSGGAVWASGTGYGGTVLIMQSDSNLVEYAPGSYADWASNWHVYGGQATRTWNAGASGNCTWYAMERWKGFWSHHLYPAISGNADNWDDSARSLGYNVQTRPATQSVVVYEAYLTPGNPGHVAWVDGVQPRSDGTYIHIWEMNHQGLGVVDERWVKVVGGMSFITTPAI